MPLHVCMVPLSCPSKEQGLQDQAGVHLLHVGRPSSSCMHGTGWLHQACGAVKVTTPADDGRRADGRLPEAQAALPTYAGAHGLNEGPAEAV